MATESTIEQLVDDAEASYQQAKAAYEAASAVRETAWHVAHEYGWTVRKIAAQAGISFQLVGRIIGRAKRDSRVSAA